MRVEYQIKNIKWDKVAASSSLKCGGSKMLKLVLQLIKKMKQLIVQAGVWIFISLWLVTLAHAEKKHVVDAIEITDYEAPITPLKTKHGTIVLIDRFHKTIYKNPKPQQGSRVMLDILEQDGYSTAYIEDEIGSQLADGDILVIHGLPNDSIELAKDVRYWKSPLTSSEIDHVVKFVADGGGLFLTLSHHPGGSGAKPLLEAFDVKFRDGYLHTPTFPSFVSKDNKCSHFFGMTEEQGLLKKSHPVFAQGEPIDKIDFHCGAAVFREPDDVILGFPADSANYDAKDRLTDSSAIYAGIIGFEFGKGKVVVATDQGLFRNFLFTFNTEEKVHVTITSPNNDNARLYTNLMRWLSPKIKPD